MKRKPFGNVTEGASNRPTEEIAAKAKKTRNGEHSDENKENVLDDPGTPLDELLPNLSLEDQPSQTSTPFTGQYIEWLYPEMNIKPTFLPEEFKGPRSKEKTGEIAERYVWQELEKMQEPMLVIHNLVYDIGRNYEMDFLVINKERGIFVIEVKGSSKDENVSENDVKSGSKQLKRDEQFIKQQLQELQLSDVKIANVLVTISNIKADKAVPKKTIMLNGTAFSNLNDLPKDVYFYKIYNQIFQHFMVFYSSSRASLSGIDSKVQKVTPTALNKWGRLTPNDLTKEQFTHYIKEHSNVIIDGPAGSGKTELLILKASSEEIEHEKKLILCYNNTLRDYLEFRFTIKETQNFEVKTISKILCELTGSNNDKRKNVNKAIQELESWISRNLDIRHFFVDECQDMPTDLIYRLQQKRTGGYFWIFHDKDCKVRYTPYDSAQYFGSRLTKVIRNTKNIYEETKRMYHSDRMPEIGHRILGPSVKWYKDFSKEYLMDYDVKVLDHIEKRIRSAVRKLIVTVPGDIGIIVEDISQAESLKAKLGARNKPMNFTDANQMIEGMRNHKGISQVTPEAVVTIDSVSRVKGLEFKVAIVVLAKWREIPHHIGKIYVAMTRSRCLLEIICCEDDYDFYKAYQAPAPVRQ